MYAAFHGFAYRTQEGYGSVVAWEGFFIFFFFFFFFFFELETGWRPSKK